jgi:hypothetical protein
MANSFGPGLVDSYDNRILRKSSNSGVRLEERVLEGITLTSDQAWKDIVTWDTGSGYYGAVGEILMGAGDWGCHGGPARSAHFQMAAQQGGGYWNAPGTIQNHYNSSYAGDEIALRLITVSDTNEIALQARIYAPDGSIYCTSSVTVYAYVKILVPTGTITWAA